MHQPPRGHGLLRQADLRLDSDRGRRARPAPRRQGQAGHLLQQPRELGRLAAAAAPAAAAGGGRQRRPGPSDASRVAVRDGRRRRPERVPGPAHVPDGLQQRRSAARAAHRAATPAGQRVARGRLRAHHRHAAAPARTPQDHPVRRRGGRHPSGHVPVVRRARRPHGRHHDGRASQARCGCHGGGAGSGRAARHARGARARRLQHPGQPVPVRRQPPPPRPRSWTHAHPAASSETVLISAGPAWGQPTSPAQPRCRGRRRRG
ncbi:hypothetical protein FOCC_FOCC000228 [Frankliniella occidentalis]|nr:hypothetical protein FOCC_FOCC000228 [Frankliniella occidentalis]